MNPLNRSKNQVREGGLRVLLRRGFNRQINLNRRLHRPAAAVALLAVLLVTANALPQKPVSYKQQIAPILAANCNACHSGPMAQNGISTQTYAGLMKGGKRGKSVIPANGKQSLLVQYLDGRKMPKMPIGGSLKPAEIALITKWIDEGAKTDGDASPASTSRPPIKPLPGVLPQAASLAWNKDGSRLAVGTYKVVEIFDTTSGKRQKSLTGHADVVRSLAFNPNGDLLAAGGGVPGQGGEILIWETESNSAATNPKSNLRGHTDCIYGVAWRPDGKQLVSASYDKTLKLWDPSTGNPTADLKDHAEAVYACGYHSNGKFMATCSADRSVRIWNPEKGTRIYTLAGHTEMVTGLAFHPTAEQLVTVGGDKAPRLWTLKADSGESTRTFTAQPDIITDVRFAPDGKTFATSSVDGKVTIYDPTNVNPVKTIQASRDTLLSIAFSPDSKKLAVGGYDGSVQILEIPEGKVALRIIEPPKAKALAK